MQFRVFVLHFVGLSQTSQLFVVVRWNVNIFKVRFTFASRWHPRSTGCWTEPSYTWLLLLPCLSQPDLFSSVLARLQFQSPCLCSPLRPPPPSVLLLTSLYHVSAVCKYISIIDTEAQSVLIKHCVRAYTGTSVCPTYTPAYGFVSTSCWGCVWERQPRATL